VPNANGCLTENVFLLAGQEIRDGRRLLKRPWLPLSHAFFPLGGADLPKQKRRARLKEIVILAPAGVDAQARREMLATGNMLRNASDHR
jgi:hypothetical protein